MRTFKYKIKHKETGLNLRAYLKANQGRITVLGEPPYETHIDGEKIKLVISEHGSPGFYYYVPWNGAAVYWLGKKEWEVIFR